VLAVVVLVVTGCGDGDGSATTRAPEDMPRLVGTVGATDDPDAYEIHLVTEAGAAITTIVPPGTYVLELHDRSTIHDFHLVGPRADVATDVGGTGERTAVVVLHDWEPYRYLCDVHPNRMQVTFSVHGRIRTQR
jgi:hypothetical protein